MQRGRDLQRLGLRLRRLHRLRVMVKTHTHRNVLVENDLEAVQHLVAQSSRHALSSQPLEPEVDEDRVLRVLQLLRLTHALLAHRQHALNQHRHDQHAREVHRVRRPLARLRLELYDYVPS